MLSKDLAHIDYGIMIFDSAVMSTASCKLGISRAAFLKCSGHAFMLCLLPVMDMQHDAI